MKFAKILLFDYECDGQMPIFTGDRVVHPFDVSAWDAYAILNNEHGFNITDRICIIMSPYDQDEDPGLFLSRYIDPVPEIAGQWLSYKVYFIPYSPYIHILWKDYYHEEFDGYIQMFDTEMKIKLFIKFDEEPSINNIDREQSIFKGDILDILPQDFI